MGASPMAPRGRGPCHPSPLFGLLINRRLKVPHVFEFDYFQRAKADAVFFFDCGENSYVAERIPSRHLRRHGRVGERKIIQLELPENDLLEAIGNHAEAPRKKVIRPASIPKGPARGWPSEMAFRRCS